MSTIRTWSMSAVLIAGVALLAAPVPQLVRAQDHQSTAASSTKPSAISYSPPACTMIGRPCNPKAPTCCPGLSCVFQGGSTRVGYACKLLRGATGSFQELSENKLDRDELTELIW